MDTTHATPLTASPTARGATGALSLPADPAQPVASTRASTTTRAGAAAAGSALPLTARERRTLVLSAAGWTGEEIATEQGIKPATVRSRLHRVKDKLGARTSIHALARALERGDVSMNEVRYVGIRRIPR